MSRHALPPPRISIQPMSRYGVGLPIMLALTIANQSSDLLYFDLPHVDWFGDPLAARWVLSTEGRPNLRAVGTANPSLLAGDGDGFGLDPGDAHTTLIDLAALMPDLPAGNYSLHVEYPVETPVVSPAVPLQIEALPDLDASVARAVMQGTRGDGTWAGFFRGDWIWQERPPLDRAGPLTKKALALHLFLHRAFYAEADVANLDLTPLQLLDQDPLEGEAAVLRHEVIHAAQSPIAERWLTHIEQRWPGRQWRTAQTRRGFGLLRTQRERTQRRLTYRPQDEVDSVLRP